MELLGGGQMAWLGIDIGGTRIKAALMDGVSQVSCAASQTYNRPETDELFECLGGVVSRLGLDGNPVQGVGLCVPGVRSGCGTYIEYAANVPGLMGVRFDAIVNALGLGDVPFFTTSDAAAASLDAIKQLGLVGRVAVLSIGAGVGMAIFDDGKPVIHTDGGAGHIGQVDVSLGSDAPIGPDGGRGSLEAYIGASALLERYGTENFEPARAFETDSEPLRALARAVRIIHAMCRPDVIVLVGGLGIRLRDTRLAELVEDQLTSLAKPGSQIVFGADDYHAARGAAMVASIGLK
ncbi:MAG: ROK family protein [Phycisphaerales bacterium]